MKAKKVLSGALAAILLTLTPGVAVCAEEMAGQEQTENTQVLSAQEQENQEKAASYAEKIDTNEISNWPQGPAIYAASGIVMDMNSGAVLYAKKAEEKRYPASITKVLSVLTALQYAKMSDTVVFSEDSISFLQWDDAQIGMKPGEEINMESALYGMLLASANEVSYAVAENVGKQYLNGGYAEFIEEMNRISQELDVPVQTGSMQMGFMMTTTIQQRMIWRELQRQLIRMKSFEDWRRRWNTKFYRRI